MSEFTDFSDAGMSETFGVLGTTNITIGAATYAAVVDQFSAARTLELGGFVGEYDGTAVIRLSALSAVVAPIERTLEGKTATVGGRTYRIDRVVLDEISVTLALNNPRKITS